MRLTRSLVLAAVALVAACGSGEDEAAAPGPPTIQTAEGSYRGVFLGDRPAALFRVLGPREPADHVNDPLTPLGAGEDETDGPTTIVYPGGRGEAEHFRYEHASFGFWGDRLLWIEIIEPGASTEKGIAVGDPLGEVESAYPDARCGTTGGGGHREFEACVLRVRAGRFAWFGGDPITTITLASVPLEGL
jgi:hypothetical protein